jgi:hypothetical protein
MRSLLPLLEGWIKDLATPGAFSGRRGEGGEKSRDCRGEVVKVMVQG